MQICKADEFVRMPAGTVFSIFRADGKVDAENLCVKTASLPPLDFCYVALTGFESIDLAHRTLQEDLSWSPATYAAGEWPIRAHGAQDAAECFFVYDAFDLRNMIKWLEAALALQKEETP